LYYDLSEDGVIFVQCDDNEQAYLKVLMDEIFERECFIEVITVVKIIVIIKAVITCVVGWVNINQFYFSSKVAFKGV
jgi:hypothetical protein